MRSRTRLALLLWLAVGQAAAAPRATAHTVTVPGATLKVIFALGRVRTGGLTAVEVWGDLVRGLPNGLPEAGDRGLDLTPTWSRTYWGGALYWLLADVAIRERTGNRVVRDGRVFFDDAAPLARVRRAITNG